ncbi:MAG: hypothetical protein ACO29P_08590 [Bacteroidia bacterium]
MRRSLRMVQVVVVFVITALLLEACGTAKGKSCKPPRKRYYHNTFLNM